MTKEWYFTNLMIILFMFKILFFLSTNMFIHPIIMIITLLMFTLMTCMNLSMWKSNYLYSIILFLIMISGMLIIFLYFTSLISNEKVTFKFNYPLSLIFLMNMILFFILNSNFFNLIYTNNKYVYTEILSMLNLNFKLHQNILILYEYPFNNLTIMSMFYLLISLFIIIKICSYKYMSLRKIN